MLDLIWREHNYGGTFRYIIRLGFKPEDAGDINQKVWVEFSTNIGTPGMLIMTRPRLFGLATFRALNWHRDQKTWKLRNGVNASETVHFNKEGDEVSDYENTADPKSKAAFDQVVIRIDGTLQKYIDRLPEAYRTAMVLKIYEQLSYEDIATVCGCPLGTIRSRLSRSYQQLRTWIMEDEAAVSRATSTNIVYPKRKENFGGSST